MFEQRQEQRLRLLLLSPAVLVFLLAAWALLTAQNPGQTLREASFDTLLRLTPREAAEGGELPVATILIGDESQERLGEWPWPRSAYASLVQAAENGGAASVTLAISVAGDDPLSPDVLARRWLETSASEPADRIAALSVLPSNDLVLARATAGGPVALGVGERLRSTSVPVAWSRISAPDAGWFAIENSDLGYVAVPAVLGSKTLSAELREARLAAAAGLPLDRDGRARRVSPLYAAADLPAATAGLAGLAAASQEIVVTTARRTVSAAGAPLESVQVAAAPPIPLDSRGELRLWLPRDTGVPNVPAWRVLDQPGQWTAQLEGRHVFIGETLSPGGTVSTAKGELPLAAVHALNAQQFAAGVAPQRPAWAGFAEAFAVALVGVLAALAVVFLPAALATAAAVLLAILSFAGALVLFRSTGMLLDPSPAALASVGAPLAVGATVLVNMVVRDDAVRGAFHGALPQKAMSRLQRHGGAKLLHGVHREVTVLSCAFQLPPRLVRQFEKDPKDYVLFKASANDRLRRTILDHEGTVDYGEDGRLLGYWNVPLSEPKHIELACACALRMLDDVSEMSQQVAERHGTGPGGLFEDLADGRIEIGIATGPCFAGPVGLGGRNRYAALGQPVSFAGRLRARSELYGPAILADSRVFEALRHHYAFLDLDFVRRDAETAPEMIYGLVGNPFLKASKNFRTLSEAQRDLLVAWRDRDLTAATRQLQQLRGMPGVPQPYVELFERRIMNARVQRARRDDDQAEVLGP
ncbi:CHASE2 domain-containing protein [Parvularcula maris]|uniref:CHASE2 domain-containing protein n=1 Tax=Parvularcula maris TaxID=2965077 RepID=A0A9X2LA20_9PROT|nr:CHASE2 domain-containing protein [Parvularcula maris]MCQ8185728.1 CHASE2 domain-containing protein [Parvularcula maris]